MSHPPAREFNRFKFWPKASGLHRERQEFFEHFQFPEASLLSLMTFAVDQTFP
jgi:hypothetical protein